jgi:hypothetical protein
MPRTDAVKADIPGTDTATTGAGKSAVVRRIVLAAGAAASALVAVIMVRRHRGQSRPLPDAGPEAADVLAAHHDIFDGLYEPLYQALRSDHEDQLRQVLNEWEIRARHADDSRLDQAWQALAGAGSASPGDAVTDQSLRELGARLAGAVADVGIVRDDRTSFLIDEDDKPRYRFDHAPQAGHMADVEIPCWTVGRHVVERGIAHQRKTPTTQSPG